MIVTKVILICVSFLWQKQSEHLPPSCHKRISIIHLLLESTKLPFLFLVSLQDWFHTLCPLLPNTLHPSKISLIKYSEEIPFLFSGFVGDPQLYLTWRKSYTTVCSTCWLIFIVTVSNHASNLPMIPTKDNQDEFQLNDTAAALLKFYFYAINNSWLLIIPHNSLARIYWHKNSTRTRSRKSSRYVIACVM